MKRLALAVALLIGLATPSQADYLDGLRAYRLGDYATAFQEFKPLADKGYDRVQFRLGLMYYDGQGVPQDYAEAVKWFRKAAEQGNAAAQYNLGIMYYTSQGVPQDYVQAHMWSNLAAFRLPPGKKRDLAVENRDIIAAKMTPAQIAEAQRLALEWKPKKGSR